MSRQDTSKGSNADHPMVRRAILMFGLSLVYLLSPAVALGSELSGVVALTSEYIYRGRAMSDGDPAIQLGLDVETDAGFFAGLWASTIDLRSQVGERDTELDYYVGFHYSLKGPVSLAATIVRYTYPGQSGPIDYDYNELLLTATLNERYSVEYGYSNEFYGRDWTARHWELRAEWPVANAWVLGGGVGHTDLRDFSVPQYLHWDLGASARFSRLTVDLRWYDDERAENDFGYQTAGSQLVISISSAF